MTGLKVHVTGAIVHGQGAYGFFDIGQYCHDSNMTIYVLINILSMFSSLPPTLYLQLDNCGRENKNRFIFAFCSLLVKLKIFKKIKVSFLMVGHTHEDIDQMFSSFSTWLNKNDAHDLEVLMNGFEKSYTHSNIAPTAVKVDHLYNVSDLMHSVMTDVSGTRKPHVFRFTRNSNGNVDIKCKLWSTDEVWTDCKGSESFLLRQTPNGEPSLIEAKLKKINIEELKHDLEIPIIKSSLSQQASSWWSELITHQEKINKGKDAHRSVVNALTFIVVT